MKLPEATTDLELQEARLSTRGRTRREDDPDFGSLEELDFDLEETDSSDTTSDDETENESGRLRFDSSRIALDDASSDEETSGDGSSSSSGERARREEDTDEASDRSKRMATEDGGETSEEDGSTSPRTRQPSDEALDSLRGALEKRRDRRDDDGED